MKKAFLNWRKSRKAWSVVSLTSSESQKQYTTMETKTQIDCKARFGDHLWGVGPVRGTETCMRCDFTEWRRSSPPLPLCDGNGHMRFVTTEPLYFVTTPETYLLECDEGL